MARARHPDEYAISLFPMFNILICTLGILIFILGALATLALGVGRSVLLDVDDSMDSSIALHAGKPRYFEWDGATLTAHPGGESVRFESDLTGIETFGETYAYIEEGIRESALQPILQAIGESAEREYVVLLVRPSGFESLYEIRGYMESRGLDIGYEPVMQGWGLRLPE